MALGVKIKDLLLICLIYFGYTTARAQANPQEFLAGTDRPALYLPLLRGKTVAVVTNQTGKLRDGTFLVDFLLKNHIKIKTLFAPEHGFRGEAGAGEQVKDGTDTETGLPIISLYGNNKKPTAKQLEGIDVVLFDIQDVGVRFYTYISTLTYVMEACAENNVQLVVNDRPNPHDGYTDGPILKPEFSSFVGLHPVPVIYGLTIGEYGMMINSEGWLKNGLKANYTVIPMQGYHKKGRYPLPAPPSPNLKDALAINLYPSLCFFEGTQVSVGRGTDSPFKIYGHPDLKDMPYSFTPRPNAASQQPPLQGQLCFGEDLSGRRPDLRSLNLAWLINAYRQFPNKADFFLKNQWFDKLAGTDSLRKQIIQGKTFRQIQHSWKAGLKEFEATRQRYILYPD